MNLDKFTKAMQIGKVQVTDPFWKYRMEIARTKVIPYQWEALNDRIEGAFPSHSIQNFIYAADITAKGLHEVNTEEKKFKGFVFQDSDLAKWIEAVGLTLMWHKDSELEKIVDGAITLVCAAQQPDGYLNTYYIINGLDKRWTNLRENHELYCLGHLIEASVAYFLATGKDELLKAVIRYVDYVDTVFGPEPNKLKGYPGHEVIEMALIRLYEVTNDEKHLKLAKYFIDQRGQKPNYFEEESEKYKQDFWWKDTYFKYGYYQAHMPVREQEVAIGHAVRAVYLYSGMADVARYTEDDSLYEACERIFNNIQKKQMYITGNIGSSSCGESFSFDYDLPNDTIYGETCASVGLVFFAKRMLEIEPKSKYADVMERVLYNGAISGISLDGTKFFYVNPLEVTPEYSKKDEKCSHVKVERQKWFGCACCPPNIARLMTSIGHYIYTEKQNTVFAHLYIGSSFTKELGGKEVQITTVTNYPWDEDVTVTFNLHGSADFIYAMRIPGWCKNYTLELNGAECTYELIDGYAYINRTWSADDKIELHLSMPVQVMKANPKVRTNLGKVAIMRGPIVYCLEEADNGSELYKMRINNATGFNCNFEEDLLGGVVSITTKGEKLIEDGWNESELYQADVLSYYEEITLKWIPYYAWANRTPGEMMVWMNNK